jgi:uncharacterized protein (DUF488 family)
MAQKLYTLGYESAAIDDFIATLKSMGIERIIDVREYPLSRRKGFSKNILHALLNANDIEYIHLRGLGDPKEGREAARAGDYKKFLKIFSSHMKTEQAQNDLKTAIDLSQVSTSCLLCYERSPDECHRTIVATAMVEDTGQKISPIGVPVGIAKKKHFIPNYPDYAYA